MGRKRIEIKWDEVSELLEAGCLGTEIAASLGIHEDTLYNACQRDNKMGFSAYSAEKKAKGNSLLRKAQFAKAIAGDNAMLIWLGKNRLEQVDKKEIEMKGDNAPTSLTLNINRVDKE